MSTACEVILRNEVNSQSPAAGQQWDGKLGLESYSWTSRYQAALGAQIHIGWSKIVLWALGCIHSGWQTYDGLEAHRWLEKDFEMPSPSRMRAYPEMNAWIACPCSVALGCRKSLGLASRSEEKLKFWAAHKVSCRKICACDHFGKNEDHHEEHFIGIAGAFLSGGWSSEARPLACHCWYLNQWDPQLQNF